MGMLSQATKQLGNSNQFNSQLTMVPLLLLLLNSYSTVLWWVPPLATGPLGFVPSMPSLQSCSGSSSFLPLLRHPSNHRISPVSPPFLWHLSLSLSLSCSFCSGVLLVSPLPLLRCLSCPGIVSCISCVSSA